MRASVGRKLPRRGQPVTPKHPRTSNFKCHEKANTSFPVTCHRVVGSRDGGSGFPAQRTTDFQFACGYPSTGAGAARAAACPAAGAGIPSGTAIPATATARTIRTAAGATGCPAWTTSRSPNLHGHDREVRRQIRTARLRNRHYIRYRSLARGEQARREKSSGDRHTRSEWKDDSFATERTLKTALEPQGPKNRSLSAPFNPLETVRFVDPRQRHAGTLPFVFPNRITPTLDSAASLTGDAADETQLGLSCGFLGRRGSLHTACEQLPIYGADDRIEICGFREIVIHFGSNAAHCGFKSRICGQENCHAIGIGFSHGVDDGESIAFSLNVEVWSDSRTSNL